MCQPCLGSVPNTVPSPTCHRLIVCSFDAESFAGNLEKCGSTAQTQQDRRVFGGAKQVCRISAHRQNQQCHVTCRSCASHLRHLCTPFRALASDALANSVLCPSYRCSTLSSGRQIFCRAGGGFRSRCDVTVSSTGRTHFILAAFSCLYCACR